MLVHTLPTYLLDELREIPLFSIGDLYPRVRAVIMSRPLSFTAKRALAVPQDEFEAAPQKPVVVVTGGSGKLGRATVVELQQHGWQVINMDRAAPPKDAPKDAIYMYADLEDMGQIMENLIEVDTVRSPSMVCPLCALRRGVEI